jgi:hypothetical protein
VNQVRLAALLIVAWSALAIWAMGHAKGYW